MTAHSETEAASPPATMADAAADFESYLFGEDGEEAEEDEETESEGELEEEGEDADLEEDESEDEEGDDESDEPEVPAIEAPVSLNAEEKAVFAQLPKEAQDAWAASEGRRNKQVQEATTKASQAQREAEDRAATANAEAKRVHAEQLNQFVAAFAPQRPDPQLAQQDPQRYIAAQAQYEAQKAQHDDLVQQISAFDAEATQEERQAFIQQRDRELMAIPEIANAETRDDYIKGAMEMAAELGYDQAELAEGMSARDIKALALARELKAKADKYDAAMSRKMQRVRSGKARTNKPGAPQAKPRGNPAKSWERVKTAKTKEGQAEAFADFMGL